MTKLRVMVTGAGNAGQTIARCLAEDGRAEPVAFCDPVAGQRKQVTELYPQALVGDDYHDLLTASAPDVVVVAGPDHLHATQAIEALEHGCHVLIEKPFATTVPDARRLLEAEAAASRHVMVDFTCRYTHPWSTMAQAARSGQVGPIFFLEGNYIHDMWDWYDPAGQRYCAWRVNPDHPQDILLGGGCHALDLMLWIMQDVPVDEVFCYRNHLSGSALPKDDCYLVALHFQNGTIGKLYVTSGCNGAEFGRFLEVYGADGTLREGGLLRRGHDPLLLEDAGRLGSAGGHGWPGAVADFLEVVTRDVPNPIPSVMGARNVAICEAAFRSAQENAPCPVEWFT